MSFSYSHEDRELVIVRTRAGRVAPELVAELEVNEATIQRWAAQDRIDSGDRDGLSSSDQGELVAAVHSRIAAFDAELVATRLASGLFANDRMERPNEIYRIVAELGAAGHGLKAFCRLLQVATQGFFRWKFIAPSNLGARRALPKTSKPSRRPQRQTREVLG